MKIDMTCKNVENKVFKALPDGDYNASIISTTLSTTNRPTLIVEFQLVGEKSVNGAMLNNRKEKYRILLDTEYTADILGKLLKAINYDYEDVLDIEELVNQNQIIGKMCSVHLQETTYLAQDGTTKPCNRVKYVKAFDFSTL